ncbi:trypsin-like peptidase domain-containing protein [Verrucosispora sp. WMMC514]|uniref:VMAP-C domain-containing protein n=1 Tax=Verrucosispora sp. WMMC514 TaxID=3015156 RepID=UPI00248D39DA|nr:trypsin-like peptidase domain-containing protein [Verrucosispora sp. WMMC514]WBB93440.1 trypsin-like peptidase domain-containing protein [Verrucosispora sp. WMMC514]
MTDRDSGLRDLAADCCVRVGVDVGEGSEQGGSGTWIAPGAVLTCAHVVPDVGMKVEVGWHGQVLTGTVTDRTPQDGYGNLWPYPDLAIIQVTEPPSHPCAWLSEAPPTGDLLVLGHSATLGEGLRLRAADAHLGGWHEFGNGRLWQFAGLEVVPGMSGGPVLDLDVGAVCGIVTTTVGEGADRGGYLVPIDALRQLPAQPGQHRRHDLLAAHDRFHHRRPAWPRHRGRAVDRLVLPTEEAQFLGLVAELAPPTQDGLLRIYGRFCADNRPPANLLTAYRDLLYALLDNAGPPAQVVWSVVEMAHHLVRAAPQTVRQELHDWITAFAARHRQIEQLQSLRQTMAFIEGHGGVVSIQIVPGSAQAQRFRLTVTVQDTARGHQVFYQDPDAVHTLTDVMQAVSEQLRYALSWLGGSPLIEFVVPVELFDEPFDELTPTRPYLTLGRKYRTVLRDYDRQADELTWHDWQRRWHATSTSPVDVRWITCREHLSQIEFSAELEQRPQTSVIALTRQPSSYAPAIDMLRVALESGLPIGLWRRGACPEHDHAAAHPDCTGQRFYEASRAILTDGEVSDLPEAVRLLRNRIASQCPDPTDRDCHGVVLLYDDPTRTICPLAPIRQPPYQPLEPSP